MDTKLRFPQRSRTVDSLDNLADSKSSNNKKKKKKKKTRKKKKKKDTDEDTSSKENAVHKSNLD